ncbi:MAG: DNA polymerase III subunit delta' [Erythrobacter sp.]
MDWPNHDEPWRQWRDAMSGDRMHHGWILAGKRGLGKRDFASAAARELVQPADGSPQPANHPDILTLTNLPKDEKEAKKRDDGKEFQTKRNIAVDQIRQMQKRLTTRPTLGDKRAIIVDPADDMESSASNALLKSLEEPPIGTFFLLVTHRPARLLPTIRSRCRILRFPELNSRSLEQMLNTHSGEGNSLALEAAQLASGGSYGMAKRFVEEDLGPIAATMGILLKEGDPQFARRGELAKMIGNRPSRTRLEAVLDLAQAIAAQGARTAEPERRVAFIEAHSELVTLAGQAPTFNFDAGLLAMEIGTLLVSAAPASDRANA